MESAKSSSFLRQQEKLYANGPRDVFLALVKHLEEHQITLRSSGKITTFVQLHSHWR
jgi:hypothetical protein